VYFSHGDLIHLECNTGIGKDVRAVERFLVQRLDGPVCQRCIASTLTLPYPTVRKVVDRLGQTATFRVERARCTACREVRVTIVAAHPLH
jgi:hypothetical protein